MRIHLSLISVLLSLVAASQIVDDSTKLVYGPKTTEFTNEFNILNNLDDYQRVDTSIYLFERQSLVDKTGRTFQSLGNFGTALFPVFYTPQNSIGRTSGFNAYSAFQIDPSEIKYYDTKSPFIEIFTYLGGGNRNLVNVGFSRNVNEDWNIGFDLKTITTNKQLAPANQTDRQVIGTSFVAYSHYKKKKYQALLNFSSMSHKVIEVGGARPTTDSLRSDFFLFDNALVRLEDAQGIVNVSQWHLYQDYQIADQFQLYHVLDRKEEKNTFTDDGSAAGSDISYNSYADFYDDFFLSGTETNEQSTFTTLSNEVGIKGDLSSVFYRFYAKLRTVDWTYLLYDPVDRAVEEYLGGYARFSWRDKFAVTANLEYLLGEGYQFQGNLSSDLLSLKYTTKQYRVPFIFSDYFGNHHEWHNDFDAVITNQLEGQVNLDFKSFEIRPKLSLTSYTNFLYFDQNINPVQSSDAIISSIGGDFNLRIYNAKEEGIHLENE
ncbi:MAG: hypothetical protein HRT61_19545, partial [Ekhidna sp.]|nr:hypothetical protein [Ekhidna sp.]